MKNRKKIIAVKKSFLSEIVRLEKFDSNNQKKFSAQNTSLNKKQLVLLTESIFFKAFREYENFIRDIFLLYAMGKFYYNNKKVVSYLKPLNFYHAEKLIQSSMPRVDWNTHEIIIHRADLYLRDGFPIKTAYSTNLIKLNEYRKLRNHIAHNSSESLEGYKRVLINYFGTIPLRIPLPGEYLLLQVRHDPSKYGLLDFFNLIRSMANSFS